MSQVIRLSRFVRSVPPTPLAHRTPRTALTPLLVAIGSLGSLVPLSLAPAAAAAPAPLAALAPPPPSTPDRDHVHDRAADGDHLTVTVRKAGGRADGTYEVDCHPSQGSHPDVAGACAAVDRNTRWGRDAFGPASRGGVCTMQYGGPATAHVTGTWARRPVDATFDRSDGCEIGRWDRLVPLLPKLSS